MDSLYDEINQVNVKDFAANGNMHKQAILAKVGSMKDGIPSEGHNQKHNMLSSHFGEKL